jgi:hypothetical protein
VRLLLEEVPGALGEGVQAQRRLLARFDRVFFRVSLLIGAD